MRKQLLLLATSALVLCCNVVITRGQAGRQNEHDRTPRFEIGGQIFSFKGHELGFGWGAGARFTYNINDHLALDNEINFFLPDEGAPYATQGLAGVKAGKHGRHLGLFAKARPGFQTNFVVNGRTQSRFAMDVGGVVEAYANRHVAFRVDLSDVIIPFGNNVVGEGLFIKRPGTTHNFQVTFGIGIRF